jgi:hypothetical protein
VLLKVGGRELEIIHGKFVCFDENEGETSHFSEWNYLDPELQEKFKAIRGELLEVMENFIHSADKAAFEAISEEYKKDQPACGAQRT